MPYFHLLIYHLKVSYPRSNPTIVNHARDPNPGILLGLSVRHRFQILRPSRDENVISYE